jgi:hypothetical protein
MKVELYNITTDNSGSKIRVYEGRTPICDIWEEDLWNYVLSKQQIFKLNWGYTVFNIPKNRLLEHSIKNF